MADISFNDDDIKRLKAQIQTMADAGKWSDVIDLIDQMMLKFPDDPALWYQKGIAFARLDRNIEAEQALLEAQRIRGEDKQIESALTWVRERVKAEPDRAVVSDTPSKPFTSTMPQYGEPQQPKIPFQEPVKRSDERPSRAQMPAATSLKVLNAEMALEELKKEDRVPPEQESRFNEVMDLIHLEKFKEAVDLMDLTIKVFEDVGPRKLILSWSRVADELREIAGEEQMSVVVPGATGVSEQAVIDVPTRLSTGYPWDPNPELVAKANSYDEQGIGETYNCDVIEGLNYILVGDLNRKNLTKACVKIYPDLVATIWRPELPGCLEKFATRLSKPIASLLAPLFDFFQTFISGFGCILHFPAFIMGILLIIPMFILKLLMLPFVLFIQWLQRKRLEMIIRLILKNPKSPYAIMMLFKLTDILPRYWRRGDIVQIVRVNVRRFFITRGVILLVQDNPIPTLGGCSRFFVWPFTARRRIYALRVDKLDQADVIASKLAKVLGLNVIQGRFAFNRLRLD